MIITKTPYRISFFGGGTDYPGWYQQHGGRILSTSIGYYNYISCRYLPPFHPEYKNRIAWNITEYTDCFEDIQHNAVRAALLHHRVPHGVEISNQRDLPTRSGIGSSSSFCVGLLKAVHALKGETISRHDLAREAIYLEREILKETGGIQDQIAVAYGGLNQISISPNGSFSVSPLSIDDARKREFSRCLMLFFTGTTRISADFAQRQADAVKDNTSLLSQMASLVDDACRVLTGETEDLDDFGKLLHETWILKRSLAEKITNNHVDDIYEIAMKNGALGGKLLGAGGGGFMLFYARPELQPRIKEVLRNLVYVPFSFDEQGCQIILNTPNFSFAAANA